MSKACLLWLRKDIKVRAVYANNFYPFTQTIYAENSAETDLCDVVTSSFNAGKPVELKPK